MTALPPLYHFSAEPLVTVEDGLQYSQPEMKPRGLWCSAETGIEADIPWDVWCRLERVNLDRLACCTPILLEPDARVLHLRTADAIREFHTEFAAPSLPGNELVVSFGVVHWKAVADDYQGIVIAPYQWELRLEIEFLWYYGWDCASGCIWDASAVREIGTAEERELDLRRFEREFERAQRYGWGGDG